VHENSCPNTGFPFLGIGIDLGRRLGIREQIGADAQERGHLFEWQINSEPAADDKMVGFVGVGDRRAVEVADESHPHDHVVVVGGPTLDRTIGCGRLPPGGDLDVVVLIEVPSPQRRVRGSDACFSVPRSVNFPGLYGNAFFVMVPPPLPFPLNLDDETTREINQFTSIELPRWRRFAPLFIRYLFSHRSLC
jgi:hypothetical protein